MLLSIAVVLVLVICIGLIVFQVPELSVVQEYLSFIYTDDVMRILFGGFAAIVLIQSFVFYQTISLKEVKDKRIAFDNPSGRVSVSLLALEELVKKTASKLHDIREIKAAVNASKKGGIQVSMRVTLRSDMNIPELTSHIQDVIKRKIIDTIGIDESVNVSIYVSKILAESGKSDSKDTEPQDLDNDTDEPNIPYQGYRV
jgi:uncharacterized alkaline shock family protein YloU